MAARKTFNLDVVTPTSLSFSGEVEQVIVTTVEGKEGFLANHTWTCKLLDVGELWIKEKGMGPDDWRYASVTNGFIDVKDDIVVYVDGIEWGASHKFGTKGMAKR